ncbi:heavy-metal-associated domain-containing protein [Calditrichota bacterium]
MYNSCVPNISCHHCVATIQRELSELEGMQSVKGDVSSKEVEISWIQRDHAKSHSSKSVLDFYS